MNTITSPGYFQVQVVQSSAKILLQTNSERLFIIDQLRQLLTYRSVFDNQESLIHLAHHIDLLAFSITKTKVTLICFSISKTSLQLLANLLCDRLVQYQQNESPHQKTQQPNITITRLVGVHHALTRSVALHLSHEDWEFDRYSSIGFYLHDRRGDWMRLWRLTQLYDYSPNQYRRLLTHSRRYSTLVATSRHE